MPYRDTITFPPKGKINGDADLKSVPKGDIIDAMNCRWGFKNDGTVGAVENIKGNQLLNINLPSGTNRIIGGCPDFNNNSVIVFLYNSENNFAVLNIDMIKKEIEPILWNEPDLKFDDGYILGSHVLDGIIYYLNTNGELQNINIEKCLRYTRSKFAEGIGYWRVMDFVVQHN